MSESDLDHAADDIRWLGARLKGLLAAADALKDFGSISNAIREKTAIHADLESKIEAARKTLDELKANIAMLNGEHGAAKAELEKVNAAHRRTVELLGGALKHVAPQ